MAGALAPAGASPAAAPGASASRRAAAPATAAQTAAGAGRGRRAVMASQRRRAARLAARAGSERRGARQVACGPVASRLRSSAVLRSPKVSAVDSEAAHEVHGTASLTVLRPPRRVASGRRLVLGSLAGRWGGPTERAPRPAEAAPPRSPASGPGAGQGRGGQGCTGLCEPSGPPGASERTSNKSETAAEPGELTRIQGVPPARGSQRRVCASQKEGPGPPDDGSDAAAGLPAPSPKRGRVGKRPETKGCRKKARHSPDPAGSWKQGRPAAVRVGFNLWGTHQGGEWT
ncbi:heat shock factor 2-binding protein isoform X5 [Rhinolophus sinicus]|uniref:heat shock factor 2-binding protein isoform X5 n=1 Tax=Rhinolophus sinicus TaxID=89399 RepID=UPI003D7ABCE3